MRCSQGGGASGPAGEAIRHTRWTPSAAALQARGHVVQRISKGIPKAVPLDFRQRCLLHPCLTQARQHPCGRTATLLLLLQLPLFSPCDRNRTYAQGSSQALAQLPRLEARKLPRRLLSWVALTAALCALHSTGASQSDREVRMQGKQPCWQVKKAGEAAHARKPHPCA